MRLDSRIAIQELADRSQLKEAEGPQQIVYVPYKILDATIGEGGDGNRRTSAEQRKPILVRPGSLREGHQASWACRSPRRSSHRFEAERQALALMNHSYIARVPGRRGRRDLGRP